MDLSDLEKNKNITIIKSIKLKERVLNDKTKALFIIPDMHLHLKGSSDFFKQNEKSFLHLLNYFEKLKKDMHKTVKFVQLGDMYELWTQPVSFKKINKAYKKVINKMDSLNFKYIYGNHDYDLSKFKQRKKYKIKKRRFCRWYGKVYLEHGYVPDFIEKPSFWFFNRFALTVIRFFQRVFCSIINVFFHKNKRKIPKEEPGIFSNFAYLFNHLKRKKYYSRYDKNYSNRINYYTNLIKTINKKNFKIAVLAHTHRTYLINTDDDFYYMDCGAWTEDNRSFGVILSDYVAVCEYSKI